MVNVLTEIIINRQVDEVSAYAGNPDNAPQWYVNIHSAEWKTPPPLRVGSLITFKAGFLGRDLEYTYEIAEYVPGVKLRMRTAQGPFPMETTYIWESVNGATRMTLRNAGEPKGFSKFFAPVMSMMMRRANQNDLKLLKRILEASDH